MTQKKEAIYYRMMTKEKHDTTDRELSISRLLNAPVQLVWKVFTTPEHIKQWWGPNGFTNTIDKMEVKPGGTWEFVMHGPDGTDFKNKSIFKEIVKEKRIVFEHLSGPKFTTTITFEAQGQKTLISWRMLFESKEEFSQVVKTFKADIGLKQNIDKLEDYLIAEGKKSEAFTIERTFNAPVALVWKALTNKDEMKKWYFDLEEFKSEPGFKFKFVGQGKDGTKHFVHLCEITEVEENKKLAYSWSYEGFEGYSVVTFELVEHGSKTTLKLTHAGLETFHALPDFARQNFVEGWTAIIGTNLENYFGNN